MHREVMPGLARYANSLPSLEPEELRLQQLDVAFAEMEETPPGNAIEYRQFARYNQMCMADPTLNPAVYEYNRSVLASRPQNSAQYISHILRLTWQYTLRHLNTINSKHQGRPRFPYDCQTFEGVKESFEFLFSNDITAESMLYEAVTNENQANIPKRYAGVKLAALAYAHLLGDEYDYVDMCTSAGGGLIQLGGNFLFNNVRVVGPPDVRELIHRALRTNLPIRKNLGIEKIPSTNLLWVETCSKYPAEYEHSDNDVRIIEIFKDRVDYHIIHGDSSSTDDELSGVSEARRLTGNQQVGLTSIVNGLWEIEDEIQSDMPTKSKAKPFREVRPGSDTENAFKNLEKLGRLAVIQEAALPSDGPYLRIGTNIYKTPYSTFAKSVAEGQKRYDKLGTWRNFRCHTFYPSSVLIRRLRGQQEAGRLAA